MIPISQLLIIASMCFWQSSPASTPDSGWWQPPGKMVWQWQLQTADAEPIDGVDVYDLDAFDVERSTIDMLKETGAHTICYVNVGAWEGWRPDAEAFPAEIIGAAYPEWEDERFVDIRRLDVLGPILKSRFDLCADKGFDAIEPDNMDSWSADAGFPLSRDDAIRFAEWMADAAHERGLAIAQKNAPELTADLVEQFDLVITEDCAADGWCDEMQPYLDAGKPVLAAEYTDRMSEQRFATACDDPSLERFSLLLKHRDLDSWRADCRTVA